jgi:hypothetical protein
LTTEAISWAYGDKAPHKDALERGRTACGSGYVGEVRDPLDVIEMIMRYFLMLAETKKNAGGKLRYYKQALHGQIWLHIGIHD